MALAGIDLGCTYGVIATMEDGRVVVLSNTEGKQNTPCAIFFQDASLDHVLVGDAAVFSASTDPVRCFRYLKRHLGTDFQLTVDGQSYPVVEVYAAILKKLKADAEMSLGEPVTDVVVAVPAYFGAAEREATKQAAGLAGLNVRALVDEPIAAAIDFSQTRGEELARKTLLVYHLGGATLDVTVLQAARAGNDPRGPLDFRILGTSGSRDLGGLDWDRALAEHVAERFTQATGGSDPRDDPHSYDILLLQCQQAKEALSFKDPTGTVSIACTHAGTTHTIVVSREQFESLTAPLLQQTADKVQDVMHRVAEQGVSWQTVDHILLSGGSTKMPAVMRLLEQLSGKKPVINRGVDFNVARGAAYVAFAPDLVSPAGPEQLAHSPKHCIMALRDLETPARRPSEAVTDSVQFTVTVPATLVPGRSYLLDVWAHREQHRTEVLARARQALGGGDFQHRSKGGVTLARGTLLSVQLHLPTLVVDDPEDVISWEGDICGASFPVTVPADARSGPHAGTVTCHVDGLRVAKIHFETTVGPEGSRQEPLRVGEQHRYRTAFASYASADRDEVLARIQGIQKVLPNLDVFLDVVSLRSGQRWSERLAEEITCRDVFYLFWSQAASRSDWVDREWRTALDRRGIQYIDPVPLASPQEVPPPPELAAHLHFNDWVLAYRRGKGQQEGEKNCRTGAEREHAPRASSLKPAVPVQPIEDHAPRALLAGSSELG